MQVAVDGHTIGPGFGGDWAGLAAEIKAARIDGEKRAGMALALEQEGGAEPGAHVAADRRIEDTGEYFLRAQLAGGNAVLGAAAAEKHVFLAGLGAEEAGHLEDLILENLLEGGGEIDVDLVERGGFLPDRNAGLGRDPGKRRLQRGPVEADVAAKPEATAAVRVKEPRELGDMVGRAVRGQAHDLVFGTEREKAEEVSDERVKHAEPVLVRLFPKQLQLAPTDDSRAGGVVLTLSIDTEKGGALERRGVEGAGDMGKMVPGVMEAGPGKEGARLLGIEAAPALGKDMAEGTGKRIPGAAGQVEKMALEALLGEDRIGYVRRGQAGGGQAIGDGEARERPIMLHAGVPFLLR